VTNANTQKNYIKKQKHKNKNTNSNIGSDRRYKAIELYSSVTAAVSHHLMT